jgi:hypothetical protein
MRRPRIERLGASEIAELLALLDKVAVDCAFG